MSGISKLLNRFDFFNAHWDPRAGVFLAGIWLVILACAISSIRTQGFSAAQQRFWIIVVIVFPIVGLLAYLPFSIKKDDLPHYFRFKPKDRPVVRPASKVANKSSIAR